MKLDTSSDYWQIKVDRESSNLLTLGTIIGRSNFKGLTYGIHSTSEIFRKTFSSIVSDIQGSENFQDDIMIWAKTLAEHGNCLRKVLLKVKESGLILNKKNVSFAKIVLYFWDI